MEYNFFDLEKKFSFNDLKRVFYYFVKYFIYIYVSILYVVDLIF